MKEYILRKTDKPLVQEKAPVGIRKSNNETSIEKSLELFPSLEEIQETLKVLLGGKESREIRVRKNEEGVHLYEIEVSLENGEKIEYNYQKANYDYRDPTLSKKAQFSASISTIKYDTDGMPYGGETVANYLDGNWSYTS